MPVSPKPEKSAFALSSSSPSDDEESEEDDDGGMASRVMKNDDDDDDDGGDLVAAIVAPVARPERNAVDDGRSSRRWMIRVGVIIVCFWCPVKFG